MLLLTYGHRRRHYINLFRHGNQPWTVNRSRKGDRFLFLDKHRGSDLHITQNELKTFKKGDLKNHSGYNPVTQNRNKHIFHLSSNPPLMSKPGFIPNQLQTHTDIFVWIWLTTKWPLWGGLIAHSPYFITGVLHFYLDFTTWIKQTLRSILSIHTKC